MNNKNVKKKRIVVKGSNKTKPTPLACNMFYG